MTTPSGLRRPPGRYDEPRLMSRPALAAGATLLVVALTAFSVVAYRHYAQGRAPFRNLDYTVQSDEGVLVRFEVVKDAGTTVRCLLQARDRDNLEVGSLVATVGPEGSGTVTRAYLVRTSHRAVAGEVLSCRPAP
ncbi:MAG: DUF4307 domain-containing protein [Mycobacteriales bacterium]